MNPVDENTAIRMPKIPYLPVLDTLDIDSVKIPLEGALRLPIMTNNWPNSYPYVPITAVSLAYGSQGLYLHFTTIEKGLRVTALKDDTPVHYDSCLEAFIATKNESPVEYINFEFNAAGICAAARRTGRHDGESLSEQEYKSILRSSNIPLLLTEDYSKTTTIELSVMIPFSLLGIAPESPSGTVIKANFYKCGDCTIRPHFASWAPINTEMPDFHRPEFFKELCFV